MNIGLDIDNVITRYDFQILKEFLKEDKNKRNSGIVNKNVHITQGMFDWTQQEKDEFFANNMENIAKKLLPRRNCKKFIDKLIEDGHKIFLISNRVYPHYKQPEKTTEEWLKKYEINYDKLVISKTPDKTEECRKYNIDLMVDDRENKCEDMRKNGIYCILMLTQYNKKEKGDLPFASSWEDLYNKIIKLNKK